MKTLTKRRLLSWRPCYSPEQIDKLWGDRPRFTAQEIAAAQIPVADRLWVLIQMLPAREQRLLACDCAARGLPRWEQSRADCRPREAIDVARRYAIGSATIDELHAARHAAAGAVHAARHATADGLIAAGRAAGAVRAAAARQALAAPPGMAHAARAAARDAAREAAHEAAWEAAWDAAWEVAYEATWAAEREWQVTRALWYLEELEDLTCGQP